MICDHYIEAAVQLGTYIEIDIKTQIEIYMAVRKM